MSKDTHSAEINELLEKNRKLEATIERLRKQEQKHIKEDQLKDELINLLVHDMKNPIFVIQGNIQMMTMLPPEEQQKSSDRYFKRIDRSSRGLLRMVLNLLDISQLGQSAQALEPEVVDLPPLIEEVLAFWKDLYEQKENQLIINLPDNLPMIYIDRNRFARVLDNLFNYTFQNAPEKSPIIVETEMPDEPIIYLRIAHHGSQIPKKFHKKIFDRYSQVELKQAGFRVARGLGLVFCKLFLESSGGSIQIDSTFKEGTCLRISLPRWRSSSSS